LIFPEGVQEYRMEQIEQLKVMRDAAKARIEALPDFRLMTSLSALIDDLESALGLNSPAVAEPGPVELEQSAPAIVAVTAILPEMEQPVELPALEEQIAVTDEAEPMPAANASSPDEVTLETAPSIPEPDIGAPLVVEPEIIETEVFVLGTEVTPAEDALVEELTPSAEALEVLEAVEEALSAEELVLRDADDGIEPANDEVTVFGEKSGLSESEEEAVNRALAELSVDLDEDDAFEPVPRPSILRR
jgi:hypothetical protein